MGATEYEKAIASLLAERAEIDQAIAILRKRGGAGAASGTGQSATGQDDKATSTVPVGPTPIVGEVVAHPGEFHAHSFTQAAEKLLRRAGRPAKTTELIAAMRRAGMKVAEKPNAPQVLYTSLSRIKGFVRAAPNTWGLSEWFPNRPDVPENPRKAKRRGTKRKGRKGATKVTAGPEPVDIARAS